MQWTQEKCDLLFSMREEGKSRAEIAIAVGATIAAATVKHHKLKKAREKRAQLAAAGIAVPEGDVQPRGRKAKDPSKANPRWSVEHNFYLVAQAEKGVPFETIGRAIGRTRWACKVQYYALKSGRGRGVAATPLQAAPPEPCQPPPNPRALHTSSLFSDADLRARIAELGLTSGLMGDPAPGRSALDRKRAGLPT